MAWSDAARQAAAAARKLRATVKTKGHANTSQQIKSIMSSPSYRQRVAGELRAMRSGAQKPMAASFKNALASTKYRNEQRSSGGNGQQARRINNFLKQRHIGLIKR